MKLFGKTIIGENLQMCSSETPSGELALRIEIAPGFSILLVKKGVRNPFWSIQKTTARGNWATILKGWWDESVTVQLSESLFVIIDETRVIVSFRKIFPAIKTGYNCTVCGGELIYIFSDNPFREHAYHGIDFAYQDCPACGDHCWLPGYEPEEEAPEIILEEVPVIDATEVLEIREEEEK